MRNISTAIPRAERRYYDNSGMGNECRAYQIDVLRSRKRVLEAAVSHALKMHHAGRAVKFARKLNSVQSQLNKLGA